MLLIGGVIAVPVTDRIVGFAIALFVTANVRDSTPRERLVTIAISPFVAFVATSLGALLLDQRLAAAAIVPVGMFAIAYGAARGPRYASLGLVGLIAYFTALVTREPPETLPFRFIVLLLAAGDAALIRCVLLPERPEEELVRLRRSIRAGMSRVLRRIAAAIEAGGWTAATLAALRRDTHRLGEAIMLAQARVAALGTGTAENGSLWLHLLTIELAIERVTRIAAQDLGGAADRAGLLAALRALSDGTAPPPQQSGARLATALTMLAHALAEPPRHSPPPAAPPPPAPPAAGVSIAIQTALAAALAIASGELVSPNRWYWAAFAAFVMFQGTRSRGESIAKGIRFMIGTIAGVVVGMLAATLLSGHELLTMAAIVVAVFLAFQANLAAYGVMIFWITIILGLLFGMLGYFPPELLLVRLKEAAAGAVCGVVVASLVLVRRDYAATNEATIAFLRALGQSVDGAARVLLDGQAEPQLGAHILAAEQRFHELDAIAEAEESSHPMSRNEALRRRMLLLEACEQWARELGQICLQRARLGDPALIRSAREAVARIDASLSRLITSLARAATTASTGAEAAPDLAPLEDDEPPRRAVRLLLRIDAALLHLAQRE